MLTKLLEQDHGQEARTGPAPRDDMEGRWRLADLLAILAGEFLPDRLDKRPLPRDRFQSLGHVLAEFSEPRAAATVTCRR